MERTEAVAPLIERRLGRWGRRSGPPRTRTPSPRRSARASWSRPTAPRRRFAKPAGIARDESRPLGIAARRYYRTYYHPGPWFESWLDLWEGDLLLPGYGWLFPVAGGRSTWAPAC